MESCKDNSTSKHGSSSSLNLNFLERRRLVAPNFIAGGDKDSIVERKLLYRKLPQQNFLKLSVLKLDGSLFEVDIGRNATVGELKLAIEELFSVLPGEGLDNIPWSIVWGHFCLCYEGQKLVNNKACIRNLGIKDGDQLKFIKHMSINQASSERRSKHDHASRKCYHHERQQNTMNYEEKDELKEEEEEEEEEEIPPPKLAQFFRGCLS